MTNSREVYSNKIESDEIFTNNPSSIPEEFEKKYTKAGNKFYDSKNPGPPVFEDKGRRLETNMSSEGVAETLVAVAQARGWDDIKVSGTETFRRQVWLEAAARGIKVKGYLATVSDKARLANKILSHADVQERNLAEETLVLRNYPELAGTYAMAIAMEKKAEADGLTAQQQAIVRERVRQNLVRGIELGHIADMKIKAIAIQREPERSR